MKLYYSVAVIGFLLFSCGSKKGVVTKKKKDKAKTEKVVKTDTPKPEVETPKRNYNDVPEAKTSVDVYIDTYADIAKAQMRSAKIPASITLAQGILESGSGNGRLAVKANNHFGIKCHGWTGAKIYHDDDKSQECFRKYKNPETSYKDHSEFLTGRKRYAKLFQLKPNDYKGWARGLKKAGYATDPKYPQKLISLIERYQLYAYDEDVLGRKSDSNKTSTPIVEAQKTHTIVKGDTLYSLSRRYGVSVDKIKSDNNLNSNNLAIGQVLIIKSE